MSAPNKNFDPVEVTALSPGEVGRAVDEALAAIAAAKNQDELKAARLAHAGDRAPLTQARSEIGALLPQARPRQASGSGPRKARSRPLSPPARPNWTRSATSGSSSRKPSTSRCRPLASRPARGTR